MSPHPLASLVLAAEIPAEGRRYRLEATEEERSELAQVLGIPAVSALAADIEARRAAGGAIVLRGELQATVTQTDVVTLEPVEQTVSEEVDVTLLPDDSPDQRGRRAALSDPEDPEGRDRYRDGRIDLGAIVTEHLALGLDPYPRAAEAEFEGWSEDDGEPEASPFAALARLKTDDG